MIVRTIYIALFLFLTISLYSQTMPTETLPRGLTAAEKLILKDGYNQLPQFSNNEIIAPPFTNPKAMAEWEELQSIIVVWASQNEAINRTITEIIRHAREECEVIVVCADSEALSIELQNAGIDVSSNVTMLEAPFNSIWVRDFGPNTVYSDSLDSMALVDWVYNRVRPNDDTLSVAIAEYLDVPLQTTVSCPERLVHTGGNYMSDGLGLAFSSNLVLSENNPTSTWTDCPLTESEIDGLMNTYMGIEEYIKMTIVPFDKIHHIDMHMKLLDEKTLLVGEYPEGVADGPQIEANLQYVLDNFTTTAGEPFEVIRVPMPPGENGNYPDHVPAFLAGNYRTYTNALFVNNTILVPIYDPIYDAAALQIWEAQMPGYNIVGIECDTLVMDDGAIHCVTKEVGVKQPLWISTNRVVDACENLPITVYSTIKHAEGISTAAVFYRTNLNDPYQSISMMQDINPDDWFIDIPAQEEGTLYYYIEATATNGKTMRRPMPAPAGYFTTQVLDCIIGNEDQFDSRLKMEAVFPNPASAITCIPITSDQNVEANITMFDILGKEVTTIFTGAITYGASKYFINANDFAGGTYFIRLQTNAGTQTQKLTIR